MRGNLKIMLSCGAAVTALRTGMGAARAADTTADFSAASSGIEEIVVTADRRTESVQNVPMTVQAFSGQALVDLNVKPWKTS